jgi:exopolysaccharide production protein ExoQ
MEHHAILSPATVRAPGRRAGQLLAALGVALPVLAVFAPLGLAPLLATTAVALLALDGRRCLAGLRALLPLAGLLAALSLWAVLSAAWSLVPQHSLLEGLRLLAICAAGLVAVAAGRMLEPEERQRVARGALLGVGLAAVLLIVERFTGGALTRLLLGLPPGAVPLTRYDRAATTLALALWPALLGAGGRRGRWIMGALAATVLGTVLVLYSQAAVLAVVAGLLVFPIARLWPRLTAGVLVAGLLAGAVALPAITPDFRSIVAIHQNAPWLKVSAIHRLAIWRFTADRIAERPLLGWGMDASRALPGGRTDIHDVLPDSGVSPNSEALPLHPHDALLQWEVELGIPGTLLCLAAIGWVLWRIGWTPGLAPRAQACALAFAAAAIPVALLSYGVWQAWWQSCLWLAAALLTGVAGSPRGRDGQ